MQGAVETVAVELAAIVPALNGRGSWCVALTPRVRSPEIQPSGRQMTIMSDGAHEITVVSYGANTRRLRESAPLGRPLVLSNCWVESPSAGFARSTDFAYELKFDTRADACAAPGAPHGWAPPPMPAAHRFSLVAEVVRVGRARRAAFAACVAVDVVLRPMGAACVVLELDDADGACGASGGAAAVLRVGAWLTCRDVCAADGERWALRTTRTTSVHPIIIATEGGDAPLAVGALPIAALPAFDVVGVAEVEARARAAGRTCRLRVLASMTTHNALGARDDPRAWTQAPYKQNKSSTKPTELRLDATLEDATGEVRVRMYNAVATELLGATLKELMAYDAAAYDAATCRPLYRVLEWTLEAKPCARSERVWLKLVGVVDSTETPRARRPPTEGGAAGALF